MLHGLKPVGVVVNGEVASEPCLIAISQGRLFVRRADFNSWGIRPLASETDISIDGQSFAALDGLVGIAAKLDDTEETLLVQVDPALFPAMHFGRQHRSLPVDKGIPAQYLGYDLSVTESGGKFTGSAFIDAGLSGSWGAFGTTMAVHDGRVIRFDSTFRRDFPDQRLRLDLGDIVTHGGGLSRAVRFAGIRLGTDFSLAPDDITYPLPVLSGSTALPSTVELAEASSRQSLNVQPGAFSIDYQPTIDGAGDVAMTIRDAAGVTRHVTQSFYTSPRLLKDGLDDFSLEAGFLREDFGLRSFAYGAPFAAVSWRHGLSGGVTLAGHVAASVDTQMAEIGAGFVVPEFGEFNFSAAASQSRQGSGIMWRAQFQRITRIYSITGSYQRADATFAQVGDKSSTLGPRSELAISSSLSMGRLGSLTASCIESDQGGGQHFSTSALSYAANVGPAYVSLGARRTRVSGSRIDAVFGSMALPLGARANASLVVDESNVTASFGRAPPPDRGLGYRFLASYERNSGLAQLEGAATLRTGAGEVEFLAAQRGDRTDFRLEARGAFLAAGGKIVATPRIGYAFAVVDVVSDDEVTLYYENRPVARKAGNGRRVVISGLQPYSANRISADLDALPIDAAVTSPEKVVVPGYRQAVKISFGASPAQPATLLLTNEAGAALLEGLAVSIDGDISGMTGYGGEVFLTDLKGGEQIVVSGPGIACRANAPFPPVGKGLLRLGPVSCFSDNGD